MKVAVTITLRKSILDPQGKAIEQALGHLGFDGVQDVRQGKLIEMNVPDGTSKETVADMCRKLLANPITEDFDIMMVG